MSCWETFQTLDVQQKNTILLELQQTYGGSFEFDASIYLMQWLDQQPWGETYNDNLEGENIIKAKQLMDDTIAQLYEHKKKLDSLASISVNDFHNVLLAKKVQEVIEQIEAKYGNDPVKLFDFFHGVVSKLRELVISATTIPLEKLSTIDSEDMDMEESAPPDPHAGLRQELELLAKESQKNDGLLKEIEQLKEQYVIKFQEVSVRIAQIDAQKNQINSSTQMIEKEKKQRMEKLKQESDRLQQELSKMGEELSINKRLGFIESVCHHIKKLSEVERSIFEELAEWRHLQQRSLCGFPCPQALDKLQEICEVLAELLWELYKQASQLDNLFHQAFQGNEIELKRMENVKISAKNMMQWFLSKTFIVERQPPQVLKKETKFGVVIRHLIGDKLNVLVHPPEVSCSLLSEKQAQAFYTGKSPKSVSANTNPVLNHKKTLEFNQVTRKLIAEFKNLSLTKATRQGGKNKEVVTEEKSALVFTTQITLGKEQFNIWVMSVPVVVTVHGNQQCDAEATIFWENAFSEKERKLFDVPDQIEWPRLADALNKRWVLSNGRELTPDCVAYLGTKLFPGKMEGGLDNAMVTRQMLNRDHMNGRSFSFWKWYYGALDVVYRRLVDEWRDGHVAGFVSKQEAHARLRGCNPGTFILRFSDSELGGVSVAYVSMIETGQCEVFDVEPWTNAHLQMRKFSDRLKDLRELVYLYPNIDKDAAFSQYYTNDENVSAEGRTGYQPAVLALRLVGNPGGRSPMHQGSQDGSMETPSTSSFPVTGFPDISYGGGLYPGSPASPASPQSVASTVLDTDLGLANQEIVGDFGQLASELALSNVFLSGLHQGINPGPASYLSAMAAAMGDDCFADLLLSDDVNAAQPQ
ncbi:unnamed protein product [Porites evermanni]|uniref:Signal transducer and activator of transcription n=2 Tax=Porites TaxID=46719 RepID=A0ABN8LI09_9CNID|nr:unnamed protein product [Porites evermanni]